MTAFDVDSGRDLGRPGGPPAALRCNLEAAEAVARQLRLRNLGGRILVDFIALDGGAERRRLLAAFRDALADDPARPQLAGYTRLGLVELRRRRDGDGLAETIARICPSCGGLGREPSW